MKYLTLPIFVTSAALLLSGCASYNARSLNTLASEAIFSSSPRKEDVIVVAKAFNKTDCKRYLDRDVLAKGYQPVQLYIENNSDTNYVFSLNRISLSCARPEEVADKVHTSTVGRVAAYGTGGLFLWPLLIPAIVDGVKSSQANEALDIDFYSKTARDQIIQPHSHFNKLLFVPRNEYQPNFHITLVEPDSHNLKKIEVISG
jgi:hypothetical protein